MTGVAEAEVEADGGGDPAAAILVRPDGHVAWAGGDLGELREAVARWFGEEPA